MIKPGFRAGFRGRTNPPSLGRRTHYLAAQQGRDSARLLGMDGKHLSPAQAIEAMGGKSATYHEVIVALSEAECRMILGRNPSNPPRAAEEAGQRLVKAYAMGDDSPFPVVRAAILEGPEDLDEDEAWEVIDYYLPGLNRDDLMEPTEEA